jgi:hypothetical protein
MSDTQSLDQAFSDVSEELLQMFLKKHKDYGKGNILSVQELGIALRISEKIERIKHILIQGDSPANETIDETWVDVAVYAVIAILLRRGQFETLDVNQELLDAI